MKARAGVVAAVAAAALVAAGCGGGGKSDKEKIESTLRDYYTAFAAGDADKACAQLSTDTREALVKASRTEDCPSAISKGRDRPDVKRFLTGFKGAKVLSVKITGNTATARVRSVGVITTVNLEKDGGGDWKIANQSEGD